MFVAKSREFVKRLNTDAVNIAGARLGTLPVNLMLQIALNGDSSFGRREEKLLAQSFHQLTIATFDPSALVKTFPIKAPQYNA